MISADSGKSESSTEDDFDRIPTYQTHIGRKNEKPPFKNNQHPCRVLEALCNMKKQNLMCDVTLVAGGVEVPAHKNVLAACSPYFYAMFTSFEESRADKITLQGVDSQALLLLVDSMYAMEIGVTEDNVQVLLPAANLLQLPDVRDACCDFLQSQLHPSNCLGIQAFADLHCCRELMHIAEIEVVLSDEFLALSAAHVTKLISSDRLSAPSEEKVFEAVMSWLNSDLDNRKEHVSQLMEHVRLPLLTRKYLVQRVEDEPLLKTNPECKDFLIEAMKYHLLKGEGEFYTTPRTKPRTPVGLPKILLVVGGQAPKAIRSVEAYDINDSRWYHVSDMPTRRCREGLAVVNGLVYAVGGFNGSLRVRTVEIYDPATDQWTVTSSMEARRSTLGVGVLNGSVYAVGGFDGTTGLNSAECYNVHGKSWRTIASMSIRRSSVGVGVLNGMLYAVGGYDGASRQCLSSVEQYNPTLDKWVMVAKMSAARSGAGVGVLDNYLYAVGGHDGPLVRKSVERYNPETNLWSSIADMILCRRNAGVVSINGFLYVIGGDDGSSNLSSVEMYDTKLNAWTMLSSCMSIGRSYAGCVCINKVSTT
uniref:Kelch-like protein diablo n=1 Tax=Strigamia maritima TaxID=126957 RepID=T1J370_STRMM